MMYNLFREYQNKTGKGVIYSMVGRPRLEEETANTTVISFKASEQLKKQLYEYAVKHHRRRGEVIRAAIAAYISQDPKE